MKLKRDVTFIVGNGFNYFLKQYMSSDSFKLECANKVKAAYSDEWRERWLQDLQTVLEEYCNLMDKITIENTNTKGEFFLQDLEQLFEKWNLGGSLMEFVESEIAGSIQENMTIDGKSQPALTARNILKIKSGEWNKNFFTCLKDEFETKRIRKHYVFTTNYDNLVDKAFTSNGMDSVCHLHGYFSDRNSIVCCSPEKKKEKTEEALKKLKSCLETSRYVVLFGLGLTSDPHILEVLNDLNKIHFIIIDANPYIYFLDKIKQEKKYAFLHNDNKLQFINTVEPMVNDEGIILDSAQSPEMLIKRLHNILAIK